jgi:hypothetical protein
MNPRFLIISALAVSVFATSVPQFARASSAQIDQMTEDQREELLLGEIYKRMEGGMNSGGGNSLKGKMIESYRVDHRKLKGYNEVVVPVLNQLKERNPGFAKSFSQVSNKKTWFLVPAEFSTIPRAISGIPANTEQTALNKKEIVWISQNNFAAKSTDQAGILVLHEMVMNYIMNTDYSKLSTVDLISKTQIATSALLDMHKMNDFELADALTIQTGYFQQEKVAQAEVQSLIKKAKLEQLEICKKYDLLKIAEDLQYGWQGSKVPQALNGMRALLKVELKLLYPLFQNQQIQVGDKWIRVPEVAKKNKLHKSDIDVQLSERFSNEIIRGYIPIRSYEELPTELTGTCMLYDCTREDNNFAGNIQRACHQEIPTDDYGW